MIGRPRVLVVEDEPQLRHMLTDILSERYDVGAASNGREALDLCAEREPDAIVLDLMMPVMDGREFLLRARTDLRRHAPVVVATAAEGVSDAELYALGARSVLRKPFDIEHLERCVAEAISAGSGG